MFPSRLGQMLLLFFSLLLLFLRYSARAHTYTHMRTHSCSHSVFLCLPGPQHSAVRWLTWLQDAVCFCVRACLLGKLCPAVLSARSHFSPDNKVHGPAGSATKASFCIPPSHVTTLILTYTVSAQRAELMVLVLHHSMAVNFYSKLFPVNSDD